MLVVTISGKAEAGKDFCAQIMKEHLEEQGKKVIIVHYADYLKFIAKQYFGWDGTKSEEGREILQRVGTNIIRERQPDFWVNIVSMLLSVIGSDYDYVLIPDCRFPNEVTVMKELFPVFSVYVVRLNYENKLTEAQRKHPSETALDDYKFNYILTSKSGREYMEEEVYHLIKYIQSKGDF